MESWDCCIDRSAAAKGPWAFPTARRRATRRFLSLELVPFVSVLILCEQYLDQSCTHSLPQDQGQHSKCPRRGSEHSQAKKESAEDDQCDHERGAQLRQMSSEVGWSVCDGVTTVDRQPVRLEGTVVRVEHHQCGGGNLIFGKKRKVSSGDVARPVEMSNHVVAI
jgi:hypothetical protein